MTPRRMGLALVTAGLLLVVIALPALAVPPPGTHCPDGWITKDESGEDDNDLVLEEGTIFCVKAGSPESTDGEAHTGILVADGETTLQEYLFAAGIVDGSGEQGRDVSYWVTYPEPSTPPSEEPPSTPPSEEPPSTPPSEEPPSEPVASESIPDATGGVTSPPAPTVPDTATSAPSALPILLAGLTLAGLGGLVLARVRLHRSR